MYFCAAPCIHTVCIQQYFNSKRGMRHFYFPCRTYRVTAASVPRFARDGCCSEPRMKGVFKNDFPRSLLLEMVVRDLQIKSVIVLF